MVDPGGTPPKLDRPASEIEEALSRALRKTSHKLSALIPKVIETDDPELIHDTRVVCRRLQQRLSVFFPKPRSNRIRKLRRDLRRIRRFLGEWRNCDVLLALVDSESKSTDSSEKAAAWELVRDHLIERRSQQIRRCRRKLENYDQPKFIAKLQNVFAECADQEESPLLERAREAEKVGRQKWQAALLQAATNDSAKDVHAFRVATKRLRYRVELIRELDEISAAPKLELLKTIQDVAGKWHDRQSLQVVVAEALAQPELILRDPQLVRVLLQELERIQLEEGNEAQSIIAFVREKGGLEGQEAIEPDADLSSGQARDSDQQPEPRDS